jgi:hypothetical protein
VIASFASRAHPVGIPDVWSERDACPVGAPLGAALVSLQQRRIGADGEELVDHVLVQISGAGEDRGEVSCIDVFPARVTRANVM